MRGFLVTALLFAVACGSTPKGQQQSAKLNTAVENLGKAATSAESNLKILAEKYKNLLEASGDLKKPYQEFESALNTCEAQVGKMEKALGEANVAAATYFETYEGNLNKIESESVREQARGRLEARRAAYAAFQGHLEAGIENYKPLLAKLRDYATALGLELTPATISALNADKDQVKKMADEWYKRNEEIQADVDKFLEANRPEGEGTDEAPEKS